MKIKAKLDLLCEIEKFTGCNLEMSIDESEAENPFWKEKWVSVESLLKDIKVIKKLVKKHRLEHAGLGWLEARLNGMIIDLEEE